MGNKIKGKDLLKIGYPNNNSINIAMGQISRYGKKEKKERLLSDAKLVLDAPAQFKGHPIWGKIAEALIEPVKVQMHQLNTLRAPFEIFGENEIEDSAKYQMFEALKLPVSVKGALMPDAHSGYGLPIGGVLATDNAVIPYGVGVDIGCRMCLSIYPIPASYLKSNSYQLTQLLSEHTKFGMYEVHKTKGESEVFERPEFREIPLLKSLLSKAYRQLGTSGSGNHFVEFGIVVIEEGNNPWKLQPGQYLGLLSHSGSRALGSNIARHYTYLAAKQCPLPRQVQHLAWLDMNSHDGQEYWIAMNLAGDYAQACHDDIHRRITRLLGTQAVAKIAHHHNFAWKEIIDGKECIVHRKGATPAGLGEIGIIPGSLTAPGYVVMGLGNEASLNSASHGAGRLLSRSQCKTKLTKSQVQKHLAAHEVTLIGGGIDEAPMAYKDIEKVMANQQELVSVLAKFIPKIARMDK